MRLLARYAFLAALLLAPIARAQGVIDMGAMPEQEAKSHFKVGKSLYESGRFAEAAVEWSRAYELSQRVELLYNVYVAYRDASDLPHAIDALKRYLQGSELDDATRVNLQARLRAMEEANSKNPVVAVAPSAPVAEAAPVPAEPAVAPTAAEPAPMSEPAPEPSSSGGGSLAPYVLLGVGGALVIGASVTGIIVMGNEKDIEDNCPEDRCTDADTIDKLDGTKTLAIVTDVLWISGVVAAGVGTALLLLDSDGDERAATSAAARAARATRPVASFGCGPNACAASLRGRF